MAKTEVTNPNYTLDPESRFDGSSRSVMFDSMRHPTPEFLLQQCLARGWKSIDGRVESYEEVADGWNIRCYLGDRWSVEPEDRTFHEYFVRAD